MKSKKLLNLIKKLKKQAKNMGQSEYTHIVDFLSDYVESNSDCDFDMLAVILCEFKQSLRSIMRDILIAKRKK